MGRGITTAAIVLSEASSAMQMVVICLWGKAGPVCVCCLSRSPIPLLFTVTDATYPLMVTRIMVTGNVMEPTVCIKYVAYPNVQQ